MILYDTSHLVSQGYRVAPQWKSLPRRHSEIQWLHYGCRNVLHLRHRSTTSVWRVDFFSFPSFVLIVSGSVHQWSTLMVVNHDDCCRLSDDDQYDDGRGGVFVFCSFLIVLGVDTHAARCRKSNEITHETKWLGLLQALSRTLVPMTKFR